MTVSYPCLDCKKTFPTPSKLAAHKNRRIPCTQGEFECRKCDDRFTKRNARDRHQKRCTGKKETLEEVKSERDALRAVVASDREPVQIDVEPSTIVAKEQAEQLAESVQQKEKQQELRNVANAAAANQQLQPNIIIHDLHEDTQDTVTIKQPCKTKKASPEFVYAVWSDGNRTIKAGYWKGTLRALRQRYVTVLGKNMQVMLFHCQNRILTERLMFDEMKPWHIESELYKIDCLNELPTLILSLESVYDTVQRSEHTEGGYLFTKPKVQKEGEVPLYDKPGASLLSPPPSGPVEVELIKIRLEQLKMTKHKLALQEQQLALHEQELALQEQLLLAQQKYLRH